MDLFSKAKEKLRNLYANKYFRFVFFAFFFLIVIYKYSNIKDAIRQPERLDGINIPKKINIIKKAQDKVYTEMASSENGRIQRQLNEEKEKELAKIRREQEEKRLKEVEKLRKEFTPKQNKKGKKIEVGDVVNVKMLVTNGDDFDTMVSPISIPIRATRDSNNIFGRKILGKRIGDVIIIPFKDFMKEQTFQKEFNRVKKEEGLEEINISMDAIANSPVLYRIRILNMEKDKDF